MSLMGRVQAAGNDAGLEGGLELDPLRKLDDLRAHVQRQMPVDVLANIMAANPVRAENEVRMACEKVFRSDPWLAGSRDEQESLVAALVNSVFGLGPLEPFLADDAVTEIMVNTAGSLYVERDGRLHRQPTAFSNNDQVRALIDRIIGPLGRRIDESSPMVDARLPSGHRVNAVIPPIAPDGPLLTIRKFRTRVFSLDDMVAAGSFDSVMRTFLGFCIAARKNMAVVGGTGSGKTTLLNALSGDITHEERVVTIEDSAELRFLTHPHVARLEARPRNSEGVGQVSIRELVTNSLRMRPDRIIVGECRGGEALDMLQAMNTGHDGSLTTLHANSPADAVMRLTTMVRFAADLPVDVIAAQIASALDVIVQITRSRDGRRFLSGVSQVAFDPTRRICLVQPLFEWDYAHQSGVWRARPAWMDDAVAQGYLDGGEVLAWMRAAHI